MKPRLPIHTISSKTIYVIFILMAACYTMGFGQLSPGKLTKSHADLEGMTSCTKCHTVGEKIDNNKCLECHDALTSRIKANKGYHASYVVKGKDCISCHSEHHGLKFEMIRFDKTQFNHQLTGYVLEGRHLEIDCAKCHKDENISNKKIRDIDGTFLGLDPKCISCHEDKHQKTLSQTCTECHNFESFKPATKFDHNKADFTLVGAHKTVDCVKCHEITTKEGKPFQVFAGVAFNNCTSCHKDPHHNEFGQNCKSCHNEESFHIIKANSNFNHEITGFVLKGKHRSLDCKKCHDNRVGTKGSFQEFAGIQDITCTTCHQDVHENKLGNDCAKCHDESSFTGNKARTNLDHDLTNFKLEGKHKEVDCAKCHKSKMIDDLAFGNCIDCHIDYHKGDFKDSKLGMDCATCHEVGGFQSSSFTVEMHSQTKFSLDGAHLATPCFACHKKEEDWKFRNIGLDCKNCHEDIHQGFISEKFYPEDNCKACHQTDDWSAELFDHSTTSFNLLGGHIRTDCRSCHFEVKDQLIIKQKFSGKSMDCTSCHENVHNDQFAIEGVTDCKRCHGFEDWSPINFDHDKTNFRLEGAHKDVACAKCHKPQEINGKTIVEYKIQKFECIDCHN